jgi:sugar phosphate isomerase/epimerase
MNEFTNFAVMSYSFHGLHNVGAMNLFGYLETVRYRYGLLTADIWNGFVERYDDNYIKLVKQNTEERGLTVVNFCCDGAHVWDDDLEVRAKNEKMAWDCLKFAKAIGAKSVRIDAGVRDEAFSEEQLAYVSSKYKEYCAYAAGFGAKLGTENQWGASTNFRELNRLFDAMEGTGNFAMLLHLGNWKDAENSDAHDREMISRAMHIHIDYEHCADADRVLPPLADAGYTGCWTVESHKSTNEYNNVAFQLAQIKRVLAPLLYDGAWRDGPPSVKK